MDARWHHTGISVSDMDQALEFFCGLLGFEVEWDMDHRGGEALSKVVGLGDVDVRIVMLAGYGVRVELLHYYSPAGKAIARRQCDYGLVHIALQVKDIHSLYGQLVARGASFNCPPQKLRPGVWASYMQGPDGIVVELVEYME